MPRPSLPLPGSNYDAQYFNQVIRALNTYFVELDSQNVLVKGGLILTRLSGSGANQPIGSLWDNNGTVCIVLPNVPYAAGVEAEFSLGTVTVTT